MPRIWLYGMVIPGILGLASMAAIVLPGDGDDLTYVQLLSGCAAMIAVCVAGGYVGGRVAGRRM